MVRRTLLALAIVVAAVGVPAAMASAAETAVEVPQAAGIMPAVSPPSVPSHSSPVAPLIEVLGLVLLTGGSLTVARSWVSTAQPG